MYNIPDGFDIYIKNDCIVIDIFDENNLQKDDTISIILLEINKTNPFDMYTGVNASNMNILNTLQQAIEPEDYDPFDDWDDR